MALSEDRRAARVFMLRHAACWLLDLESTDLCIGADGEFDQVKLAESKLVAKRLEARPPSWKVRDRGKTDVATTLPFGPP